MAIWIVGSILIMAAGAVLYVVGYEEGYAKGTRDQSRANMKAASRAGRVPRG